MDIKFGELILNEIYQHKHTIRSKELFGFTRKDGGSYKDRGWNAKTIGVEAINTRASTKQKN